MEQFSHDVTGGNRGPLKDIRDFKIQRRGRQREGKKKRFNKQNNNFPLFVHFFPVFARLGRENALFRVYGGR